LLPADRAKFGNQGVLASHPAANGSIVSLLASR
jgi:hypothetical protein